MLKGYFQDTYWPDKHWAENYWAGFVPVNITVSSGSIVLYSSAPDVVAGTSVVVSSSSIDISSFSVDASVGITITISTQSLIVHTLAPEVATAITVDVDCSVGLVQVIGSTVVVWPSVFVEGYYQNTYWPASYWDSLYWGQYTPVKQLNQYSFRFRLDDGNEGAASWIALENTEITLLPGNNLRIRFGVVNKMLTNNSVSLQLEYRAKSIGGVYSDWMKVLLPVTFLTDDTSVGENVRLEDE